MSDVGTGIFAKGRVVPGRFFRLLALAGSYCRV